MIEDCNNFIIENSVLEQSFTFKLNDGQELFLDKEYDDMEVITCDKEKKVVFGNFIKNNLLQDNLGNIWFYLIKDKILYIENIDIDKNYQGLGIAKSFLNKLDSVLLGYRYNLSSKAENPIIWIKLSFKCVSIEDKKEINRRLKLYLTDNKIGKSLSLKKAEYIIKKGIKAIDTTKYLLADKNIISQIGFTEFYKKFDKNTDYKETNNLNEMIKMYKEVGV